MALSCHDQKKLAILSPKYPNYCKEWDEDEVEPLSICSISADSDYETDFYNSDDETIEPTKKTANNTGIKSKSKLEFSEDLYEDVLKLAMEYSDVF